MSKKERNVGGRPRMSERGGRRNLVVSVTPELDDEIRALAIEQDKPLAWMVRELVRLGMEAKAAGKKAQGREG
jgi:hypothetical protein